jgi:hypothetical protein
MGKGFEMARFISHLTPAKSVPSHMKAQVMGMMVFHFTKKNIRLPAKTATPVVKSRV